MKTNYKHTYVICAYKESPYLEACIRSLVNQTVQSNIILYTSTPNQYIKSLTNRYNIDMYSKKGGSIGKDWNNALSFVNTPYVTIAHQDDIYNENYTEQIMSHFEKYPDSLIAYSDYAELTEVGYRVNTMNLKIKRLMLHTMQLFPKWHFWRKLILGLGNPISCPAVSYQLSNLSDFKFDEKMRVSLDWFAWYQINQYKGRFTYIPTVLMLHRIHEDSETTNTINDHTRSKEDLFMYELFWPKFIARLLMKFYQKSQNSNG